MFSKYQYVYAVYREKNFTRAAEKLFISQPSLSAAIKNIEKKVGAPLFERSALGAAPTQIGEEYIDACKKIMSVENEFERKLYDIYNLESGHISVGGTNYLSSYVLPAVINRFKSLYPKIEVTLTEANSSTLRDMIINEQIDLVIDSFDTPEDIYHACPLSSERILLCVPAGWEINNHLKPFRIYPESIYNGDIKLDEIAPVSIEMFRDESFVLLKNGNDMYNRAMAVFDSKGIVPRISFSVDQLNISYALAEAGMGICFVTDTLFKYRKFHKDVILYNLDSEYHSRTLYVAHKKNKYCSAAMSKFIEVSNEVINA